MVKNEIVHFWFKSSKEDFDVSQSLFEAKRYNYCLFFCHLSIEKYLKKLYSGILARY